MSLLLMVIWATPSLALEEEATPSGIPLSELEEFVDHYVDDYIGKTLAGATIVIVHDGEVVLSKGYGFADLVNKIEMEPEQTVMEWASITKLFVWTAVMQLVEEGKLDLNTDIRSYLPEGFLTKLKYDDPITLLNLMHHNAGFEEYIFDLAYNNPEQVVSLEEGLKLGEPAQVYRPGEVVAYSNYSTSLAGYIVERVTGQPFYEYVNENILEIIGMDHSTLHPTFADRPNLIDHKAKGYLLVNPRRSIEGDPFYMSMYPSGGFNGTAEDLAKFAIALMPEDHEPSPLFNTRETLDKMFSNSYRPHENMLDIAHGFWEYDGKYRGLTHGGNSLSFSSYFHIVPEVRFGVVVLTNQANEVNLTYGLVKELVGEGDKTVLSESLPSAKEVEGKYLTARRTHKGFLNLYFYFYPYTVKAVGDNEIQLSVAGYTANFVQTSPYLYKMISGDIEFDPTNTMFFHMENGEVKKVSTSIADFVPVPKAKSFPVLIIYLVIAAISFIYLLFAPIVLLIIWIVNKVKGNRSLSITKYNSLLLLSGTILVMNFSVLALRMLFNNLRPYTDMKLHFILNYTFTGISLLAIGLLLFSWRKYSLTTIQKIFYIISIIVVLLWLALLVIWQFYY